MTLWRFSEIVEAHRQMHQLRQAWPYSLGLWGIELAAFALAFGWFLYARDWFGVPVAAVLFGFWVPILACYFAEVWYFVRREREGRDESP